MAKSKKKRQQDFQKVKLKVGKKLKKADNVTNASFRTRGIQISQQLKTGDASQPSTKKKHNITDLFSHCRHYSTSVRVEAVNGLKELITTNPELVQSHLSDILERNAELLTDKDSNVRQGAICVFKSFLPLVSEKQISPFFPLLCAHLCCAMTHIYDDIQVDSLAVLDLLLDNYPRLIIYKSSQVLSNFIEQISRQKGQGQAKRSLNTNPNSATSSVKWRSSVLSRLQKFLSAILKFQESTMDGSCITEGNDITTASDITFTADEVMLVQRFPVYIQEQWMTSGLSISSSMSKDGKLDILGGKFPEFARTLIPLMLECWVESAPSKDRNKCLGENLVLGENVGMMYNVLQVTQLLWQCIFTLSSEQSEDTLSHDSYLKEFEQHFMVNFPYTVNTRVSMKGKKQQKAGEQVSAEILNLTVCDIMTNFISKKTTIQRQSHDPAWLPVVTKYLNDFLRGKYGKIGVGQSARTFVNILQRLIDREHFYGPVLGILTEVYNRFETANIASTEKKVYMQFFADILLQGHSQLISPELRRKFLQGLSELLPLCTKESSEMTSLVINTMKKGACQRCLHLLDREIFNKVGQKWFDPQGDVITNLPVEDQKSLVGLLYYAEDIGLDLIKTLVSFARYSSISDNLVSFMIQVLQNRYLRSEMRPDTASVHIGFLTNLLIGVSRSDIESFDVEDEHPVIGKYKIVMNSVLDADNTHGFDRHCFIVGVVCSCAQQFYNTDQVVGVVFGFVEKMLEASSFCVPLQMAFGICKFVDSLTHIQPAVVSLYIDLCISLVSHLITWQHSTNQNAVKLMLDLVCKLIMDIPYGLERLLMAIEDSLNTDVDTDVICTLVKIVMLFLTEGRDSCIRNRPECSLIISSINNRLHFYMLQYKDQMTSESDKLIRKFSYLVSNVNQ